MIHDPFQINKLDEVQSFMRLMDETWGIPRDCYQFMLILMSNLIEIEGPTANVTINSAGVY